MVRQLMLIVIMLAAGVLIGVFLVDSGRWPSAGHEAGSEEAVADLAMRRPDYARQVVAMDKRINLGERKRLLLQEKVDLLELQLIRLQEIEEIRQGEPAAKPIVATVVEAEVAGPAEADRPQDREARFQEAGLEPEKITTITRRLEENEMERLYLRDQATREGWIRTPRYAQELSELAGFDDSIREELGETNYDKYLFGSGRVNRVVVDRVIENSPAQQTGIQTGDIIYSYGNARVFNGNEVRQATTAGTAGEFVLVEVLRNGQRLEFYLPRGPLGIVLGQDSVKP